MRVLIALAVFPGIVLADHLPETLLAQGRPETVLCGIDVIRSRTPELLEKFGKPISYDKYPKTEEAAEISWDKEGSKIHVTINADDIAYAVRVTGARSAIAKTGRGLELGQTMEDLKSVYGDKFVKRGNIITLQWRDGTEMRVALDKGRIVSLMLIAPVE